MLTALQLDAPALLPFSADGFPSLDDETCLRPFGNVGRVAQTFPLRFAVAVADGRDQSAFADVCVRALVGRDGEVAVGHVVAAIGWADHDGAVAYPPRKRPRLLGGIERIVVAGAVVDERGAVGLVEVAELAEYYVQPAIHVYVRDGVPL